MNSSILSKEIALETQNLTKKFGSLTAVKNVSMMIEEGSIVGILGPNGAGKTTTIRLITGIFKIEENSHVKIFSIDVTKSPKYLKKRIGIVPEVSNAYSDYSVWQNIMFSGTIYGLSKEIIKSRGITLLKRFELEDKINVKTKSLSKGLKQRLNLCLSLLHEPSILILDEPMSGLDPFSVSILRNQIIELKQEGKTILITTHNMHEAQRLCDRILIMNKGNIIADETPEVLLRKFKPISYLMFILKKKLTDEQILELNTLFSHFERINEEITIFSKQPLQDVVKFHNFLEKYNLSVSNFKLKESTLEDVFIQLIKDDIKGGVSHE